MHGAEEYRGIYGKYKFVSKKKKIKVWITIVQRTFLHLKRRYCWCTVDAPSISASEFPVVTKPGGCIGGVWSRGWRCSSTKPRTQKSLYHRTCASYVSTFSCHNKAGAWLGSMTSHCSCKEPRRSPTELERAAEMLSNAIKQVSVFTTISTDSIIFPNDI